MTGLCGRAGLLQVVGAISASRGAWRRDCGHKPWYDRNLLISRLLLLAVSVNDEERGFAGRGLSSLTAHLVGVLCLVEVNTDFELG